MRHAFTQCLTQSELPEKMHFISIFHCFSKHWRQISEISEFTYILQNYLIMSFKFGGFYIFLVKSCITFFQRKPNCRKYNWVDVDQSLRNIYTSYFKAWNKHLFVYVFNFINVIPRIRVLGKPCNWFQNEIINVNFYTSNNLYF